MASAKLDLVRSIVAAWERGDFSSVDWAVPGIEYVIADGPSPGSWTGVAGLAEGWRGFLNAWEEWRPRVDEFRELDAERVLVLTYHSGRGKTSGLALDQVGAKGAVLFHIHGGKVTRLVSWFDREHAFADLGFSSDAGSSS